MPKGRRKNGESATLGSATRLPRRSTRGRAPIARAAPASSAVLVDPA